MEQLFGKVGTVKMVRICHPEAANGANQTAAKHPKTDMIVSNKVIVISIAFSLCLLFLTCCQIPSCDAHSQQEVLFRDMFVGDLT